MSYVSFSGDKYKNILEYIKKSIEKNTTEINFKDLNDFRELFNLGLFKPRKNSKLVVLRVDCGGCNHGHYYVTLEGKLKGEPHCAYPAKDDEVYSPEKILVQNNLSHGWTAFLGGMSILRNNFEEMYGPGGI